MKNEVKETEEVKVKKTENLVINLESLLIPISVLVGALMISLSIIFTFRGTSVTANVKGATDTTTANTTDTTTNPTDGTSAVTASLTIGNSPYIGNIKTAKVAIFEFSDFECPYCKQHFTQVYPSIVKNYVDTGKAIYVYKNFPLSFHEPATTSDALTALCVFDQAGIKGYTTIADSIFTTTQSNGSNMNQTILNGLAKKVSGVNMTKFNSCISNKTFAKVITADEAAATSVGISGTPGFVIGKLESDGNTMKNGTLLPGAYPLSSFQALIDPLL